MTTAQLLSRLSLPERAMYRNHGPVPPWLEREWKRRKPDVWPPTQAQCDEIDAAQKLARLKLVWARRWKMKQARRKAEQAA